MSSNTDLSKAAESFVKQLQALASNGAYKQMLHIVEENFQLKEENGALKITHREDMRTLAQLHQEASNSETLRKEKTDLQSSLANARKTIEEKREALEETAARISDLHASAKKKDNQIDRYKDSLKLEQDKSEASRLSGQKAQAELDSARKTLKSCTDTLCGLEKFAFQMESPPRDAICQHLHVIFKAALTLATNYFGGDLEKTVLDDSASLEAMRSHSLIKRTIPLPLSNTSASKQMRVAAVLTIIAECLSELIFQPTYLLNHTNELYGLMAGLSIEDPAREAYLRAVLLALSPDTQERNKRTVCGQAVTKVLSYTESTLLVGKRKEFRDSLERFCEQACNEWSHLQILADRVEPSFDTDDVPEWRVLLFALPENGTKGNKSNARGRPSGVSSSQLAGGRDQPDGTLTDLKDLQAVVWPSFLLYKGGGTELLEKGFALTEAQIKVAREEEIAEQGKRRAARGIARRAKARSMSLNGEEPTLREASFLGNGGGSKGS